MAERQCYKNVRMSIKELFGMYDILICCFNILLKKYNSYTQDLL